MLVLRSGAMRQAAVMRIIGRYFSVFAQSILGVIYAESGMCVCMQTSKCFDIDCSALYPLAAIDRISDVIVRRKSIPRIFFGKI